VTIKSGFKLGLKPDASTKTKAKIKVNARLQFKAKLIWTIQF